MGETLDFTGKILIDANKDVNLIINAFKAVTQYGEDEFIFITCYRPSTKSYIMFLYPEKHRIELARDYLSDKEHQSVAEFLCREKSALIKSARERAVSEIVYRWGACFKNTMCRKGLKYPTLEWARDGLRELETNPEKYIIWELK